MLALSEDARLSELPEVLGDGRLAHGKSGDKFADAGLPDTEKGQDPQADRVAERPVEFRLDFV